jgi:hypothetical protein
MRAARQGDVSRTRAYGTLGGRTPFGQDPAGVRGGLWPFTWMGVLRGLSWRRDTLAMGFNEVDRKRQDSLEAWHMVTLFFFLIFFFLIDMVSDVV